MRNGSRILYASFDQAPAPKGASTHIAQFVRELANHFEVTLVTPGPAACEREDFGARHMVVAVDGANFLRDTETFSNAINDILSRKRFDIVHFRSIWEGIPATSRKPEFGYKTIYEINGLPSVELQYHYPAVTKNPEFMDRIRAMEFFSMVNADAIIVPSAVTRDYVVARGISERKIKVIPNGVDTDLFKPPAIAPQAPIKILYAGTLAPWQGVSHLLEAFRRVSKDRNVRLQIVGKTRKDWLKDLTKRAKKLKITELVEFHDAVSHREMPSIVAQAHIGAAPFPATERNTKQGFCPIKVLEYMACGLPVVASDLPAVRELARDGVEAKLFKPNSMARLSDAIISLVDNAGLRKTLGEAGRKRAESFTWKSARSNLLALHRHL